MTQPAYSYTKLYRNALSYKQKPREGRQMNIRDGTKVRKRQNKGGEKG